MFPFARQLRLNDSLEVDYQVVLQTIWPLLTNERKEKIERVAQKRCYDVAVVLEGIYDRGNISAVMRTGEGLGFAQFHVIETQEKFKEANRVTQGADKWVEVRKWKSTTPCVAELKKQGYQIVATTLQPHSKPIGEIDFSRPTALVLGNEKQGVSDEMIRASDHCAIIPMPGFVQSFNISVAGALSLYHIMQDRQKRRGQNEDVSAEQIEILKAVYAMRTQDSSKEILIEKLNRQSLA